MKTINLLFVGLVAMGLTACGNQNNNPYVNGQYITPGTQTGYTQSGCVPIQSGAFGFTAQGAKMTGYSILAGTLPANSTYPGTYGTVTMGSQMNLSQQGANIIQYQPKISSSGQMQMVVNSSAGVVSGTIQLSQSIVYQLMSMQTGYYNQYPYYNQTYPQTTTNNQSQLCVQSVALDIVHTVNMSYAGGYTGYGMTTGYINQALVYLTLNNGQTIGPIPFY